MVSRFLQYLEFEKRASKHTVLAYSNDLEQFRNFLHEEYQEEDITTVKYLEIRTWLAALMEQGLSPRSVNRKKTALQSFFRFLLKEGKIAENPMKRVISPKTSKRLPVYVEEHSLEELFLQIESNSNPDFTSMRNRLVLEMFYATGMRLSELVQLKDSDIDRLGMTIRILGKRNKERIVPIGPSLATLIEMYLQEKKKLFVNLQDAGYFFLTDKGKKIYQKLAYRVVNDYLSTITTLEKKSPHVLRHTFATHMLNKGADLNAIKELLGHANLSATQVYTHNTIEKLKNIYKQAHPKA